MHASLVREVAKWQGQTGRMAGGGVRFQGAGPLESPDGRLYVFGGLCCKVSDCGNSRGGRRDRRSRRSRRGRKDVRVADVSGV